MNSRFDRNRSNESGVVAIVFAMMLPILLGMMGLVFDLGYAYEYKRQMQTAADAAAMAGAYTLQRKEEAQLNSYALYDAAKNGFDGSRGETRTVNNPPSGGDFAGDSGFVEVIISHQLPTSFLRVLGVSSMDITARAVGGMSAGTGGCVYALSGDADVGLEVSSGSEMFAPDCAVKVSSCKEKALDVTSASELTAASIEICGPANGSGMVGSDGTISPAPVEDVCPTGRCNDGDDPLSSLQEPSVPSGCDHTDFKTGTVGSNNNPYQIWPGTYCKGLQVESGSIVNFNPGTYYIKGEMFSIGSGSTATGTDVGFYLTDGPADYKGAFIQSGSTTNLKARHGEAYGAWDGMLFWQDRTLGSYADGTENKIESNSASSFEGILYFRDQHLMFHSNTIAESGAEWTVLVADTLEVSSGTTLGLGANSGGSGGGGVDEPTLVE